MFGGPVIVPRDADDAVMETKRKELEDSMRDITARADGYWGE